MYYVVLRESASVTIKKSDVRNLYFHFSLFLPLYAALRRSGVLTANGRLYIAGASSSLYSLDVASGAVQWSAGGNSLFSVEPKLVESTNNLYAIEVSGSLTAVLF